MTVFGVFTWAIVWRDARILKVQYSVCLSQIRYAVKEYACTAIDVIARRLRLAFLNVQAAQEALPTIVDILAEELKWSNDVKKVWWLCSYCSSIWEKLRGKITECVAMEE